jgi:hypothetical protein
MRAFLENREGQVAPALKELVVEASRALARLDADRLEELALSCQALNREYASASIEDRSLLIPQAREAAGELTVFSRVLDATRANMGVLQRARDRRLNRLEYAQPLVRSWHRTENGHGDN